MRKSGKDNLRLAQRSVLGSNIGDFGGSEPRALTALFVGASEDQLERWMADDQPAQLSPGISACAEDSHRNFMHS